MDKETNSSGKPENPILAISGLVGAVVGGQIASLMAADFLVPFFLVAVAWYFLTLLGRGKLTWLGRLLGKLANSPPLPLKLFLSINLGLLLWGIVGFSLLPFVGDLPVGIGEFAEFLVFLVVFALVIHYPHPWTFTLFLLIQLVFAILLGQLWYTSDRLSGHSIPFGIFVRAVLHLSSSLCLLAYWIKYFKPATLQYPPTQTEDSLMNTSTFQTTIHHQTKQTVTFALLFVLVLLVAWFVWPTPYVYDQVTDKSTTTPIRTHRITGKAEQFYLNHGWVEIGDHTESIPAKSANLTDEEVKKLEGNLVLTNYGWIEANFYNGTDKTVSSVILHLEVSDSKGANKLSRNYKLSTTDGAPLRSSKYIVEAGFTLSKGDSMRGKIISATGYQ